MERIELHGEYDLSRKEELAAVLASLTGEAPIVLDMAHVTYVDSSFLNELATLRSRFPESKITLQSVSPQLRRVLTLMRFETLFDIVDRESS